MDNFQVKTEFLDKTLPVVSLVLGGYIDQSNSDKLQKVFDNLFSSQHFNLIIDFNKVIYMSSAGWGIFVGEVKRFRENGGDIKIANMNAEIYEVFQMLEFYHIMEDFNTIEEALESYGVEVERKPQPIDVDEPEAKDEESLTKIKTVEPTTFFEKGNELYNKTQIIIKDDKDKKEYSITPQTIPVKKIKKKDEEDDDNHRHKREQELNIALLPIQEKIRKIVGEFPLLSVRQIKKMLKHEDFGRHRVGSFRLRKILKELNLETKAKRYRFYRSC